MISRYPDNLELHEAFVAVTADLVGTGAVAEHYVSSISGASSSIGTKFALALLDVRAGSYLEACHELQTLSEELEEGEGSRKLQVTLGRVFLDLGSWTTALKISEKVLAEARYDVAALRLRRDTNLALANELCERVKEDPRHKEPVHAHMGDALQDAIRICKLFPQENNETNKRDNIAESLLILFPEMYGTKGLKTADETSNNRATNLIVEIEDSSWTQNESEVQDTISRSPDLLPIERSEYGLKQSIIYFLVGLFVNLVLHSVVISILGYGFWISLLYLLIVMSSSIFITFELFGRFGATRKIANLSRREETKSRIGGFINLCTIILSITAYKIKYYNVLDRLYIIIGVDVIIISLWSLIAIYAYRRLVTEIRSDPNVLGNWAYLCFSHGLSGKVAIWLAESPERTNFKFLMNVLNTVRAELKQSGYKAGTHAALSFLSELVTELPYEIQREASAEVLETFEQADDLREATEFGLNQFHKRPPYSIGCIRFGQPLIRCCVKLGWLESSERILTNILNVCRDQELEHFRLSTLLNLSETHFGRGDYTTAARMLPPLQLISEIDSVQESQIVKRYQESLVEHIEYVTPGVELGWNIKSEKIQNIFLYYLIRIRIEIVNGNVESAKILYKEINRRCIYYRLEIQDYRLKLYTIRIAIKLKTNDRFFAKRMAKKIAKNWGSYQYTWIKLSILDSLLELDELQLCSELIDSELGSAAHIIDEIYMSDLAVRQAEIAYTNRDFVLGRALARSAMTTFRLNRSKGGEARAVVTLSKIEAKTGNAGYALELASAAKELFFDVGDREGITRAEIAAGIAKLEGSRLAPSNRTKLYEAADLDFKNAQNSLEQCKLRGKSASELYDGWSEACFELARLTTTREDEESRVEEAFSHTVQAEIGRAVRAEEVDKRRVYARLEKFSARHRLVEEWNLDQTMADIERARRSGDSESAINLLWYVTQHWQSKIPKTDSQDAVVRCEEAWVELFDEVRNSVEQFVFEDEKFARLVDHERYFDEAIRFAIDYDRVDLLWILLERSKSSILSEQLSLNVVSEHQEPRPESLCHQEQALSAQYRTLLRKSISMRRDSRAEWERHIARLKDELTAIWTKLRLNAQETRGSGIPREMSYDEIIKFIGRDQP